MRLLIFFIIFFYSFASQGVISYSIEQKNDGQSVLILGDHHNSGLDKCNEDHIKKIATFVNRGIEKPFVFYYECPRDYQNQSKKYEKIAKSFEVLVSLIPQFTQEIDFKAYDPRSYESSQAHAAFDSLDDIINSSHSSELEKKINYSSFKWFMQKMQHERNVQQKGEELLSLEKYFESLENATKRMEKWQNKYPSSSKTYKLFNDKLILFNQSKEKIKKEFSNDNDNKKFFMSALLEFLEKEKDFNKYSERMIEARDFIFGNCDYIFADAGFLRKYLKIDKNSIFLLGASHQEALSKDLQGLEYKNIAYEKIWKEKNKLLYEYNFNEKFFGNILYAVLYVTSPSCQSEVSEKFKKNKEIEQDQLNAMTIERKCSNCNVLETKLEKKLLRCGRCKKTLYCEKKCQQDHWIQHKQFCQSS